MDHKPHQDEQLHLKEVCSTCVRPVAQCTCVSADSEPNENDPFTGSLAGSSSSVENSNMAMLTPGTYIQGKYIIDSVIGEGGMGRVFKGTHETLNRPVAIKVLRTEVVANDRVIRRFDQEAKATSQLTHPNLCQVFDYGLTDGGMPFLVMDLLEGKDLRDVMAAEGPLTPKRVIDLFLAVTDGVMHAHSKGVIHRDLKPSNIILTKNDGVEGVKIVDFGIAKVLPPPGTEGNQLTQTGEIFGSPLYMSPEQCQGLKVDGRSDVYSLGCVMYECLSGKPPFEGANPVQTILKHVNESVKQFDSQQNISADLQSIVLRALAKNPDDRYKTVEELHRDLQRLHDGLAPLKQGAPRMTPKQYIKSRKTMLLFFTSLFMISTIFIIAVALFQYFQATSMLPAQGEQWRMTFEQAKANQTQRNPEYAENNYRLALEQTKTSRSPERAKLEVLQNLGDLYIDNAEKGVDAYPEAMKCFSQAADLAIKIGSDFEKSHTLERLGEIQYKLKQYAAADKSYAQALQFRQKDYESHIGSNPSPIPMASTLMKQANNFKMESKYEAALQGYSKAAEYLKKVPGQELFIGSAYRGIAQSFDNLGKLSEADGAYKTAEEFLSKEDSMAARSDLKVTLSEHADLLTRMGRTDEAAALRLKAQ